jgi:hypothetical protein
MASSDTYTIYCVVDGESTSNAFPVEIESTKSIGILKNAIKAKKSPRLDDVAAAELKLYKVSITVVVTRQHDRITLDPQSESNGELNPLTRISRVFNGKPPEDKIRIIVQRPPPGNAAHCSTLQLALVLLMELD